MEKELILGGYRLREVLGDGHCGAVRLGVKDGKRYAIKTLDNEEGIVRLKGEAKVLGKLSNPHILRLLDYGTEYEINPNSCTIRRVFYLAYECAEGGDFFSFLKTVGPLSEILGRYYLRQLVNALKYLHSCGYCHQDIKPQNVLLDRRLSAILGDFDLVRESGLLEGSNGTKGYQAPEVLAGKTYNGEDFDVFSLGVCLFNLLTGVAPFSEASCKDFLYKSLVRDPKGYLKRISKFKLTPEFMDLFIGMTAQNPKDRLSLKEIEIHPWYLQADKPEDIQAELSKRSLLLGIALEPMEIMDS